MRMTAWLAAIAATLCSEPLALALMMVSFGNQPQSSENYKRWPGLVEVVNQPSRAQLIWCNGNERLGYKGDAAALTATLAAFARTESPSHRVIFLPGYSQGRFDWTLQINEGINRAWVEQSGLQLVRDLDPVLTVHVTDQLDLNGVQIPDGIQLEQLPDLRKRLNRAVVEGNERTRTEARTMLASLEHDPARDNLSDGAYEVQVRRIESLVRQWSDE